MIIRLFKSTTTCRAISFIILAASQVSTTTACTFSVTADECSYEALEEAVASSAGCNIDDVVSSKEELADLCAQEYLVFGKIGTGKNKIWDKEYFDGGTAWNEEREYIDDETEIRDDRLSIYPGDRIDEVYEIAQENGITFPNYIDNFEDCDLRSVMCCWVQDRQANDNNGNCARPYDENCVDSDPADNTDICYVDMERAPTSSRTTEGFAVFEDESEDSAHCHGFAWAQDPTDESARFKGNNLFYVSMYDHLTQRGYVRNVPGAPMCGCVEKMPIVTRSDCTEIDVDDESVTFEYPNEAGGLSVTINDIDINFNSCQGVNANGDAKNNDLEAYYRRLVNRGKADPEELENLQETLVGTTYCREAIDDFLSDQGLAQTPACVGSDPETCGCSTVNQQDYRGTVSTTESGRTCQRWDAQEPHRHNKSRGRFPNANLEENYCRNPDDEDEGAWCYTTDPEKRWEYCGIRNCDGLPAGAEIYCKSDPNSCGCREDRQRDYRGNKSETRTGKTCQAWNTRSPHRHGKTPENFPGTGLEGGHNYCRNPDNEPGGAWCYTTDPDERWDYCDVEDCPLAYEVILEIDEVDITSSDD